MCFDLLLFFTAMLGQATIRKVIKKTKPKQQQTSNRPRPPPPKPSEGECT